MAFSVWLLSLEVFQVHPFCSMYQHFNPLLLLNNTQSYGSITFCLATYLFVDRYLCWFHFFIISVNVATYKSLCGHIFSFILSIYLGVELLDHMLILCLTFWGTIKPFSITCAPFKVPKSKSQGIQFCSEIQFYFLLPEKSSIKLETPKWLTLMLGIRG